MDHDAFNDRAAIIKDPKESSIEPCRDDCAAEGGNEAREVEDAEKENLSSDKDECALDDRSELPHHRVAQSNEAVKLLAGSTGNIPMLDEQPSDLLVTISLARLQQFLAEAIRDGRNPSIRDPDLEHNRTETAQEMARIDRPAIVHGGQSQRDLFQIGLSYFQHLGEDRRKAIEDIWNNPIPWELTMLELQVDERLDPTDLVRRCDRNLELHQIFTSPETSPDERNISRAVLDASVLIWHVSKARQGTTGTEVKERDIMFGVIMCCCLAARRGNITIGNILKHVYGIGVLKQPIEARLEDYSEHNLLVIECALAMNRTFQLEPLLTYEDQGWKITACGRRRVEKLLATKKCLQEVLGIDLVELFQILHTLNHEQHQLETALGPSFRVDDLNVKSLKSIGRLCIQWTAIIENHLLLDLEKMTLAIAWSALPREGSIMGRWQAMFLNRLPPTFLDGTTCQEGDDFGSLKEKSLNDELGRTWVFLYATSKYPKQRRSFYERLPRPPWADDDTSEWMKEQQTGQPQGIEELHQRILSVALRKGFVPYAQFPIFETRLRQLRHYMDNQKPRGFRQLWVDRRDSLNYYTFWGVVIIGVLAILLALASLAVSIAQAVASFRALDSGAPSATET